MANETEIPFKVTDIQGVSNQVLAEDLPDQYCTSLQNLYERRLGELMRKGGTEVMTTTFPTGAVSGIDNAIILKKRTADKIHLQAVHTTQGAKASYVNRATASFVTSAGGNWGTVLGSPANTKLDSANEICLQYVGFGLNFSDTLNPARGASNTLRITVPSNIDVRILGINVYATVEVWNGATSLFQSIWVGYIDLNATGTRGITYDFQQAPITQTGPPGVTGVMFGSTTKPNFTISGTTGGTLTPGKTYYVSVLEQYMSNDGVQTTCFRACEGVAIQSFTMPQASTALVVTPSTTPGGDSACYCIAVGEDPQLLQPIIITNLFASPASSNTILSLPLASPNVLGIQPYSLTRYDYLFKMCDSSSTDMFFRYSSAAANGTLPVYVSRTTALNNATYIAASDNMFSISDVASYFGTGLYGIPAMPTDAHYCYVQLGNFGYIVNDSQIVESSKRSMGTLYPTTYLKTDGGVAAQVVYDYGTTTPPKCKFISAFQESIVIGGGFAGSDAYDKIYFSNAYNTANFSDSGAGTNLAFVGLEAAGEPIMGLGIFSISTDNAGVNTQLIVGSRTKLFKLNAIPAAADFGKAFLDQLSNKIGLANHQTIVNTEIGTIICGLEDVYLIRDSGEPTPIGQDIASFINPPDTTAGQDTSFWNAVYQDGHYKLCYSVPGSAEPTKELWLNIKKMKANKGKPSWYGPHTGRTTHYSLADTVLAQGDVEKRVIINITTDINYHADKPEYLQDVGQNITTILGTKEFIGDGGEFATKKLVRFQVRGRATALINMLAKWYADGILVETKSVPIQPKQNMTDILAQPTTVFPFFPTNRIRGRTLQLSLESKTQERFGISGLYVGVQAEKRRI